MDINADEALTDLASQLALTAKAAAIQAATVSALKREVAQRDARIAELETKLQQQEQPT